MKPVDALQYLAQLAGDHIRLLAPSSATPTQQWAQAAIDTLAPLAEEAMRPRPLSVEVETGSLPDGVKSIRPPGSPAP
jgi:hypothetical protein